MRWIAAALLFATLLPPATSRAQAPAGPSPTGSSPTGPAPTGPAPAALTPADQGWVERVQDTLDRITTLKARFMQIAPDGRSSGGTVWLDRPGRMRFQYDKPSPLLLVANNGKLVFNDNQLKQTTMIPLAKTPLGLLLRPKVTLSGPDARDVTITGFRHSGGQLQITLVRTATPGDGSLTLIFSDQPVALQSWSVIDAEGRRTQVELTKVALGGSFPQRLFNTDIGQLQ